MFNSIKKILFLGPKGTYSHLAVEKFQKEFASNCDIEEVSTITKIINLIDENKDFAAIIPIENSTEGMVRTTLDGLFDTKNNPQIQAQSDIEVQNCLISNSNFEDIKYIISHPQALAQCQNYIAKKFGNSIKLIQANSTAEATSSLLDKNLEYASIGNEFCANLYGINVLDKNINDMQGNKTRFVLVSRTDLKIDKKVQTSLVFTTKPQVGSLACALEVLKNHNVNLLYIESRPSKKVFGEYNFFIDTDKNLDELENALIDLEKVVQYYKILGSYRVFD